jgi:hypothetical protein
MWEKFLEEIAEKAEIRGKPRSHFLKIYKCQDFTAFCEISTKERYESLDYTEGSYNQLLSNFYVLLSPLMSEDGFLLVKQKGRQKQKDPKYIEVHRWLTVRYKQWRSEVTVDDVLQSASLADRYGYQLHSELTKSKSLYRVLYSDHGRRCTALASAVCGRKSLEFCNVRSNFY